MPRAKKAPKDTSLSLAKNQNRVVDLRKNNNIITVNHVMNQCQNLYEQALDGTHSPEKVIALTKINNTMIRAIEVEVKAAHFNQRVADTLEDRFHSDGVIRGAGGKKARAVLDIRAIQA